FKKMIAAHRKSHAAISIAVIPVARSEASHFGIMRLNETGRVIDFAEKPKTEADLDRVRTPSAWIDERGIVSRGREFLASMGIYLFNREVLIELLNVRPAFTDFGKDVFPNSYPKYHVQTHLFDGYWEDLGTIKSYHQANLALASESPPFD